MLAVVYYIDVAVKEDSQKLQRNSLNVSFFCINSDVAAESDIEQRGREM